MCGLVSLPNKVDIYKERQNIRVPWLDEFHPHIMRYHPLPRWSAPLPFPKMERKEKKWLVPSNTDKNFILDYTVHGNGCSILPFVSFTQPLDFKPVATPSHLFLWGKSFHLS